MTIKTDIDGAISAAGKFADKLKLVMGEPARVELGKQLGFVTVDHGSNYRGIVIEATDEFQGWDLVG